jgi:hypothetical protein
MIWIKLQYRQFGVIDPWYSTNGYTSINHSLNTEYKTWLEEQKIDYQLRTQRVTLYMEVLEIGFKQESDAVLFKLTWQK